MSGGSLFCCPLCKEPLLREQRQARCANGHSFDIARQGYLHLLPANQMHSKMPGDSKEMVEGCRSFLEAGFYEPFQNKLVELAGEHTATCAQPKILDAGCGEGYYTGAVKAGLSEALVCGFDISKLAVKAAAGKYKQVEFAVGSSFAIPVEDGSQDLLLDVFSPLAPQEFYRVLAPGGILILAVPTPRHLYGMKEILYEQPYENQRRDTEYPGFAFLERHTVEGEITVPDEATAMALFTMTPYYWKTSVEGGARLKSQGAFSTEIGFDFLVYEKK